MSRTYRKVLRCGNCVGRNTEYYRDKRRQYRAMWKNNMIRSLFKSEYADEIDENYVHPEYTKQFVDRWDEPTDGSFLYTKEDVTSREIEIRTKEINGYAYYSLKELMEVKRKLKHTHKKDWDYGQRYKNKG